MNTTVEDLKTHAATVDWGKGPEDICEIFRIHPTTLSALIEGLDPELFNEADSRKTHIPIYNKIKNLAGKPFTKIQEFCNWFCNQVSAALHNHFKTESRLSNFITSIITALSWIFLIAVMYVVAVFALFGCLSVCNLVMQK